MWAENVTLQLEKEAVEFPKEYILDSLSPKIQVNVGFKFILKNKLSYPIFKVHMHIKIISAEYS